MAWENYKVEQQRLNLIQAYQYGETSMTDLCKRYGISRKTGYKWYKRFLDEGEDGLGNQSKAPHNPFQIYAQEQIDIAIDLKLRKRSWGPKKILATLKGAYPDIFWPSPTRLYEIFKEYHLVTSRKIRSRVPATAPLGHVTNCNDTWTVDLKGWFLTGDRHKCEPLTITDCHSRYLIRCVYLNKHSVDYVWPIFDEAFREFGLPLKIRSDNGPPFGSVGVGRLTPLSLNFIKAGVIPEWIRPGHPEENGRHERFHLTLKQEIAAPPKATLALQIQSMEEFIYEYNFERPHEALEMKKPGDCYYKSARQWDGILRSPEYDTHAMQVRKVGPSGCIWLKGKEYFIGQTLTGEYIGLKPNDLNQFEVYYGPLYLGLLGKKRFEKPELKTRRQR